MSQTTAASLCSSILAQVRSAVSPECYRMWFKDLNVVKVSTSALQLSATNRYVKHWLESHYKKELHTAVSALMPEITNIEIVVAPRPQAPQTTQSVSKVLEQALPSQLRGALRPGSELRTGLNSRADLYPPVSFNYRLETFVLGRSNRIPQAAAQTVAESPGAVYNPLFIHGAQGLGKTHLLQGIGQTLIERATEQRVIHVSCEEFTNEYVSAVQNRRLDSFRARYRNCDVLLMDDVQFLGGRDKTQEEFLHTFDALKHSGKQIIVCANCAPRDIRRLDPRLVTRFQSGLVARLDAPETELRMSILRAKAKSRGLELAQEVADILASHIHSNIRELEGAVCKMMALAAAERRAPDRDLAILALRELGYLRSGPLMLQDILSAMSTRYGVSADEIRGDRRHASLVRVRHLAMYLSTQLCSNSVAEIGRFYGNRDHATVLHAVKKINLMLKHDEELKNELLALRQLLGR